MAYAPPGLFTIITYTADSFVFIIFGAALSFTLAAVLTFLFGIPKAQNVAAAEEPQASADELPAPKALAAEISITSPIKGKVLPLSEVPDEAFGDLGQGVGVQPAEGKVYAPFDGEIELLADTKHAIGLVSKDGVSMLIHVGVDTVDLNGQYFTAHINTGDKIRKGQLLLEFDMEQIAKVHPTITPVIVTNADEYASVEPISGIDASQDTTIIKVKAIPHNNRMRKKQGGARLLPAPRLSDMYGRQTD